MLFLAFGPMVLVHAMGIAACVVVYGYQVLLFIHERGFFSVLLIRNTDDPELKGLRDGAAFDAACRANTQL